jgi:hypothetical protein
VGRRDVLIGGVVPEDAADPRREAGAHRREEVVLDVVAEVEMQAIHQGVHADAHRVAQRIVPGRHRPQEVVGADIRHHHEVRDEHGEQDDK